MGVRWAFTVQDHFWKFPSVSIRTKEVTRAESVDISTVLVDVRSTGDELISCRKAGAREKTVSKTPLCW